MSAMPIGAPGWPEFAFWTASILSARIALAHCLRETADSAMGEAPWVFYKIEEAHFLAPARNMLLAISKSISNNFDIDL